MKKMNLPGFGRPMLYHGETEKDLAVKALAKLYPKEAETFSNLPFSILAGLYPNVVKYGYDAEAFLNFVSSLDQRFTEAVSDEEKRQALFANLQLLIAGYIDVDQRSLIKSLRLSNSKAQELTAGYYSGYAAAVYRLLRHPVMSVKTPFSQEHRFTLTSTFRTIAEAILSHAYIGPKFSQEDYDKLVGPYEEIFEKITYKNINS